MGQLASSNKDINQQLDKRTSGMDNFTIGFGLPGNGNNLSGYLIPDEILLIIFSFLSDVDLVRNVPLVCVHWYGLAKNKYLWLSRLSTNNVQISPDRLKRISNSWDEDPDTLYALRFLCLYAKKLPFNKNLIRNPSGTEKFKHWLVSPGGDGIRIENPPVGSDPIPEEARLPSQHCFASSYFVSTRKQRINLDKDYKIDQKVLKTLRPTVVVGEWVSARFDCGSESTVSATLLCGEIGSDTKLFLNVKWNDADYGRVQWHKMEVSDDLPLEMSLRSILFKSSGKDTSFWKGFYGPKTAGSSVVLKIC